MTVIHVMMLMAVFVTVLMRLTVFFLVAVAVLMRLTVFFMVAVTMLMTAMTFAVPGKLLLPVGAELFQQGGKSFFFLFRKGVQQRTAFAA